MSDEQTIYISPDDDLTTVRERLEQIAAQRLTMVIPPQTQLRSHVAWKLLYARTRELGKEVTIVSSDPQVRSVAHAVKFKVAHSLETPPAIGKARPTSRPGRTGSSGGAKTRTSPSPSSRSSSAKAANESHSIHNRRGASNTQPPRTLSSEPGRHEKHPSRQQEGFEDIETFSEETVTGETPHPLAFGISEKQYGQSYDFRIHPTPAIHPLTDQIEEPDLLLEDYTQAQDILSAAREGQKRLPESAIGSDTQPEQAFPLSSTSSQSAIGDNLLTNFEDSQAPQTGQTNIVSIEEGIDTNEHIIQDVEDVEDLPDSIIDNPIEDGSNKDESVPPPNVQTITDIESEQAKNDEEQDKFPSRSYGVRSRRKSSNLSSTPPKPSTASSWQLDEDALPPIEEHPVPPRSSAPVQPRVSSARSSKKLPLASTASPKSRTSTGRGAQAPIKSTPRLMQQHPGPGVKRSRTRPQTISNKTHQNVLIAVLIGIILLLFAAYLLVYYGPTANVTVGITTRDYSQQVTLTATIGNQAQQFSQNFIKSGVGTATGSQEVGTNPAQGIVIFTYNGSNPNGIIIPDGSIITTSGDNPIEFATTAEVLVPPSNQNKILPPVSIQAVKPGQDGNVDANSITVIPNSTLNSIAQAQNPPIAVSGLKLSVVNEASTTGGGVKATPAVTNQDLTNVKNNLLQQLQGEINAWQQQLSNTGAVGTPQIATTLTNGPKVNDIEANGTFSGTIRVTATVLVVHTANLQKAAIKQLNDTIKNDKAYAGETILTDMNPEVTISQLKQVAANANSITFTFNAKAQTGPEVITKAYIQQLVMGKPLSDARTVLLNTPKVKTVDITVSPGFMPWITHWDGHINVIIHPAVVGTTSHPDGKV